jgi:hypothetical protein
MLSEVHPLWVVELVAILVNGIWFLVAPESASAFYFVPPHTNTPTEALTIYLFGWACLASGKQG